jgi:intein/homing endonuclease
MRIKFFKGKQKELIKNFKDSNNLTWKKVSELLKIKEGKLKAFYEETSLLDKKYYLILDKTKEYSKFIIEKKQENWGQKKGGTNSRGRTKKIKRPPESKELAEFYGIMLGDGNSHRTCRYNSCNDKRGTFMIRIVGDSRLDNTYLTNYVKPLIKNLFKVSIRISKFKGTNAMFLEVHSKELVNFLEKKGFKPGNKIKNKLRIPNWIKRNNNYLKNCLRGLYDTDGSVYKITNQNSHQICFTGANINLMKDVRNSLLKLGIKCSKISKKDIYITKKSELQKFLKVIGFNNYRHLKKVRMWNLAP